MEQQANLLMANNYTAFLGANGTYIENAEGVPLFKDAQGTVVTVWGEIMPQGSHAYDSSGSQVPAIDANGLPMVDSKGQSVYTDVYGTPILSDLELAAVLMIANGYTPFFDGNGTYIRNAEGTRLFRDAEGAVVTIQGEAMPAGSPAYDSTGNQIPAFDANGLPMVDSKGQPVYADVYGTPILSETELLAVLMVANGYTPFLDGNGTYVKNAEGTPLFRDAQGAVVTIAGESVPAGSPAYDNVGKQIPAIDANGQPMVDSSGIPVYTDVYGTPILSEMESAAMQMIANGYTPFFDGNGTYIKNAEGIPLFRDAQGAIATVWGEVVPAGSPAYDTVGNQVPAFDANGQPMVETKGQPVYADVYGTPILSEMESAAMQMIANGYTPVFDDNGTYIKNAEGIPLFRDAQGAVATVWGEVCTNLHTHISV
ncbi:hypothetical protein, variant [Sphaeroforma arctica JP610]|uniref:Uncharacterized protein n=1 Tax=Sphaeroforma arctica JP610 TaxID=667725 RepID=A0A0L0G453_9EUKA|nr:hypothetical protein, variant [Sphaeroforma arctica JP610]KNC83013.1 hypothetical protein, variant [Sphaeroforma arctica JP610]|eukprot:XP_014156915.1 hypothetical protein, variant [Sphaeroforma arctica JP610]